MSFYSSYIRKYCYALNIACFIRKISPKFHTKQEAEYIRKKDKIEISLLPLLCSPQKDSLDIGVLWGGYSYYLSKLSKVVHCFEPNNKNFNFLKKSFSENKNVILYNTAISSSIGEKTLIIPDKEPGNATIEKENDVAQRTSTYSQIISTTTLKSSDFKNVGFIKIDVEGHEYDVLLGCKEIIKEQRPNLLVEIEERHKAGNLDKINKWCGLINYQMFFVLNNILSPFNQFKITEHQNPERKKAAVYINNFILVPEENIEITDKLEKRLSEL